MSSDFIKNTCAHTNNQPSPASCGADSLPELSKQATPTKSGKFPQTTKGRHKLICAQIASACDVANHLTAAETGCSGALHAGIPLEKLRLPRGQKPFVYACYLVLRSVEALVPQLIVLYKGKKGKRSTFGRQLRLALTRGRYILKIFASRALTPTAAKYCAHVPLADLERFAADLNAIASRIPEVPRYKLDPVPEKTKEQKALAGLHKFVKVSEEGRSQLHPFRGESRELYRRAVTRCSPETAQGTSAVA
jgi:hypothetical protein